MANEVVLVAVGCLTGVLAGMLGAGGGFATVALLLAADVNPHVAVGTALVYLMVMGGWGTFMHVHLRSVDRRLALVIGTSAAAFALRRGAGRRGARGPRSRAGAGAVHGRRLGCVAGLAAEPPPGRPARRSRRGRRGARGAAGRDAVPLPRPAAPGRPAARRHSGPGRGWGASPASRRGQPRISRWPAPRSAVRSSASSKASSASAGPSSSSR